jgi:toxin ParE1/3/4
MKVFIREAAVRDLDDIFDWIFQDSPQAAAEIVRRIHARIERLAIPGLCPTLAGRAWSTARAS